MQKKVSNSQTAKKANQKQQVRRPAQMSRDEIRHINNRIRRKKQKRIKLILYSVLLICFIAVAVGLSLTVFFNIQDIEVKGSSVYGDTEIIKASGIQIDDNFFLSDLKGAAKKITGNLPYAGQAKLKRKLPSTLVIDIIDTKEYAAFDWEQGYVLINEKGKVLSNSATVLRDGVSYVSNIYPKKAEICETVEFEDSATFEQITGILTAIKNAELDKISSISLSDMSAITLMYDGRIMLKVGSLTNFERKMLRAAEAIRVEEQRNKAVKGTLDLTIDPYGYFREGKVETEPFTVQNKNGH